MTKDIKTFNTDEFIGSFMKPDPKLKEIIKQDYGRFFMVNVQDLIKISKLPVPPTRGHTHILIYLTSGVATMRIGAYPVQIHKNECLIVAAGQVFSYDQYEVNEGFLCSFDDSFLTGKIGSSDLIKEFEFLTIWGNPIIRPTPPVANYLRQTFERIHDEYAQNGLKNPTIIQSYLIAALCDLNTTYQPLSNSENKKAVALVNHFKELLHQYIHTKHQVTDYASMLNVSPNHLNKIIKQITQKSPSRWIDETLVTEAKVFLFQTSHSISDIAAQLGMYDASYFSRLFKKYEKLTPMQYRKMIEKS